MHKYSIKLYRTAKSRIPVHSGTIHAQDDCSVIRDLQSFISVYFFAKIENLDTGTTQKTFISPIFVFGNTLGYLPVFRTTGGNKNAGVYIVGVKPLSSTRFKTKPALGHFPEYEEKKLNSSYPITRAFSSNKILALKYYKKCGIILQKKGLLVNLSENIFYKLHDSNSIIGDIWKTYSELNAKNENPRIII